MPLDRKSMKVNFLGFRVRDTFNDSRPSGPGPADPGPADPGGYHACPSKGKVVNIVYAPLVEGQGYLFRTRYQQHGSLGAMDLHLQQRENCRTSAEFRFFFIGQKPLRIYKGFKKGSLTDSDATKAKDDISRRRVQKLSDAKSKRERTLANVVFLSESEQSDSLQPPSITRTSRKMIEDFLGAHSARSEKTIEHADRKLDPSSIMPCAVS